jgi:MFS family permease
MSQQAVATPNTVPKTPRYAWVALFALYMASLAATINLFKLPPIMLKIITSEKAFPFFGNIPEGFKQLGDLMAVFSIMGFVLAIPAGYILKRFGIKMTGLLAVGALVVGSIVGAITKDFTVLSFARFIEGAGMGLIMVTAPFAISVWFPLHNRALPTGLWASCVGIGNIATLLIAPSLAGGEPSGWQSVWMAAAVFSVLSFILFAILFRMPKPEEMPAAPAPAPASGKEEAPPSLAKGLASGNFWMISISFGCYNLVVLALLSFLPSFLQEQRQYTAEVAGLVTALVMAASIIFGPLGGYISDRLGKRKLMILIPYILMTLTLLIPFTISGWMIPTWMIVFGIFGGPLAPVLLATVPEVAPKPQLIGIGMSVAAVGQNVGMYIGPKLFPRIQVAQGWEAAGYWMIPICVVGIVATLFIKVR